MKIIRELNWRPATVSWLSFFLMGIIVAGIGLAGTAHVIDYLQEQIIDHGIEHNQEIALELAQKIENEFIENKADIGEILSHAIEDYKAFGYQIFLINTDDQKLVLDSRRQLQAGITVSESWLNDTKALDGSDLPDLLREGAIRAISKDSHPLLILMHELSLENGENYLLGVAKDEVALSAFLSDLHLHLDAVLLFTYLLIAVLGYFTLRSIGRIYEKRLETKLEQRTLELEAAHEDILLKTRLATIGQTASVLTHEMRNPLASIKLALSGIRAGKTLPEREIRRVELVLGEVDRLDNMLSETLDYVRPIKLSEAPVDIDEILNKVIHHELPSLENKGLKLNYQGCTDCTALRVDETQIYQVFLNLLKNGIEASPKEKDITIRLNRSDDNDIKISISNMTEPLSEETMQRVFEPFYTTKPKGTGLGMGFVKRVIVEHGGSISFSAIQNNVVSVEIQLPRNLK